MLVTATDIVSSEVGRCHDGDLKDWFVLGCDLIGGNFPWNPLSLSAGWRINFLLRRLRQAIPV